MSMSTTTNSGRPQKIAASLSVQTILQKYATAAAAATFAVVGVSGVLLFFHIGEQYLMGMHEWIGLAFVAAAAFHVVRHFRGFSNLLTKTRTKVLLSLTALAALAFIVTASLSTSGGNPMKEFVGVAMDAPVSALADVAGKTPQDLIAQFANAGINGVSENQTLKDIATSHNREIRSLFHIVVTNAEKS